MALPSILRRSALRVAPIAARFIGGQRNLHIRTPAIYSVVQSHFSDKLVIPTSLSSLRHYSASTAVKATTTSDQTLLKVLDSEIVCAEETDEAPEAVVTPENFPFEIVDVPGQQTISLSRKYQDETISVEVHMPGLVSGEDDGNDDDDDEKPSQSSIPLVVKIAKSHKFNLEFGCTAFPDEITIDNLSVRKPDAHEDEIAYEGPDFSDLDENLQKAFHKYLEIRGIKPSTTNFLHEYMINKDSREYLVWLKNLQKFVQA